MVILPLIYTYTYTHTETNTHAYSGSGEKRPSAAAPVAAAEGYRVERERDIRRHLQSLKCQAAMIRQSNFNLV